jgi:Ankyrin repeat
MTVLHAACKADYIHKDVVALLLKAGANTNAQTKVHLLHSPCSAVMCVHMLGWSISGFCGLTRGHFSPTRSYFRIQY